MNDNALRGPQWQRLVAEYLAPRLGGQPERWARANRIVAERTELEFQSRIREDPHLDYLDFWDRWLEGWLRGMCEEAGVAAPNGHDCLTVAHETSAYVTRRVHSAFPGVVDTIRDLHARGHRMHTASGEHSNDLEGYLEAMEVHDLFRALYGPDLVNVAKGSPLFYQRIFADAQVDPGRAVVVDDSPRAVAWASGCGATAVLVSSQRRAAPGAHAVIGSLAELPPLMETIGRNSL